MEKPQAQPDYFTQTSLTRAHQLKGAGFPLEVNHLHVVELNIEFHIVLVGKFAVRI